MNVHGSLSTVLKTLKKKSLFVLPLLLALVLSACGNAPSGTRSGANVPLSASPTDMTLSFNGNGTGNCTAGNTLTANLQVNGGFPPYQIFSSVPQLTGFATTTLINSGDILTMPVICPLQITGFSDLSIIDDKGTQVTSKLTVTLVPGIPLAITNTSLLAAAVVNQAYNVVMAATGGTAPLTWSVQSGNLPPGLTLNPTTGILSGVPTTAGQFSFVIAVADAVGLTTFCSFAISITGSLTITTASPLPAGSVNQFYNLILAASGGFPTYTWALTTGALPPGMTFDPATGVISGTPLASGVFNFIATATDSAVPVANTATKSLSLTVDTATGLKITTTALPSATNGIPYSAALAATGGVPPYTWTLSGGALPLPLTLPATGIISGTPNDTAGLYNLVISVADSAGSTAFGQATLSLNAGAAPVPLPLSITTAALPAATNGIPYSTVLAATGGTLPYTWAFSATLPIGLTGDPAGIIAGTPNDVAGTYNIVLTLTDSLGVVATKTLPISLLAGGALTITTTAPLPTGTIIMPYSMFMAASGGNLPYTWTSTALPAGLTLIAATGEIAGAPTTSGNTSVTVTVTDSAPVPASTLKVFSLPVNGSGVPTLTITTPSPLTAGTFTGGAILYMTTLAATGGTPSAGVYAWAVASGVLPPGLALSTTGVLSGTPTAAGVFNFVVTATDTVPATAAVGFSLTIN